MFLFLTYNRGSIKGKSSTLFLLRNHQSSQQTISGCVRDQPGLPVHEASPVWDFSDVYVIYELHGTCRGDKMSPKLVLHNYDSISSHQGTCSREKIIVLAHHMKMLPELVLGTCCSNTSPHLIWYYHNIVQHRFWGHFAPATCPMKFNKLTLCDMSRGQDWCCILLW